MLESCRKAGNKVRLVLGDTTTGESWLDECDVVGTIGRSTGALKVPLLIEDGEDGGGAIRTACVLCIIDWRSGRTRYRQPAYQAPDLGIKPTEDADLLAGQRLIGCWCRRARASARTRVACRSTAT